MSYVDGFVAAVPDGNKAAFVAHAEMTAGIFREFGALQIVECWGDDVPAGTVTDFRRAVAAEAGETVVFSWIVWPSKEARNTAWGRMMEDPRMRTMEMPFDGRRVILGGFAPVFDTGAA